MSRRRRYARSPEALPGLTPTKLGMLRWLAEMRFLSLPQLARLCCSCDRWDLAEKRARRHLRALFDAGLADVLPISRAALAPAGAANDASLLYGSAPNVYAPTAQALKLLYHAGMIGEEALKRPAPDYGPRNSLFLAHELAVRDMRVWLEGCALVAGHEVERWHDGEAAVISLERQRPPSAVRPDAWFVYRMAPVVLVGLVEADRGTERGDRQWREKLDAYAELFAGERLREATGYRNARVLVITPDARRRDALAALIGEHAAPELALRFWLGERSIETLPDLAQKAWRRPGTGLHSLVPATVTV